MPENLNWLTEKLDPKKEKEIFTEIGTKVLEKLGCEKALTEKNFCGKIGYCLCKALEKQSTPLVHVKIPNHITIKEHESLKKALNKLDIQWILTSKDISITPTQTASLEEISLDKKKL